MSIENKLRPSGRLKRGSKYFTFAIDDGWCCYKFDVPNCSKKYSIAQLARLIYKTVKKQRSPQNG